MKTQKLEIKSLAQLNCLLPDGSRFYPQRIRGALRIRNDVGKFIIIKVGNEEIKLQEISSGQIALSSIPSKFLLS